MVVTKLLTSSVTQFPYLQNERNNDIFLTGLLFDNEWDIVRVVPSTSWMLDSVTMREEVRASLKPRLALQHHRHIALVGWLTSCRAWLALFRVSRAVVFHADLTSTSIPQSTPSRVGVPGKASSLFGPHPWKTPQGSS